MKIVKTSQLSAEEDNSELANAMDADLDSVFNLSHGRIRFGGGTPTQRGENIAGEWLDLTTNGSADTETTHAHTMGSIPIGFLVVYQDKAGSIYQTPTSGTNWTSTNIYLKSDVTSLTAKVFLIK